MISSLISKRTRNSLQKQTRFPHSEHGRTPADKGAGTATVDTGVSLVATAANSTVSLAAWSVDVVDLPAIRGARFACLRWRIAMRRRRRELMGIGMSSDRVS